MTTSDPFRSMAPVFNDPAMASAAMQYGGDIAKDVMEKNVRRRAQKRTISFGERFCLVEHIPLYNILIWHVTCCLCEGNTRVRVYMCMKYKC